MRLIEFPVGEHIYVLLSFRLWRKHQWTVMNVRRRQERSAAPLTLAAPPSSGGLARTASLPLPVDMTIQRRSAGQHVPILTAIMRFPSGRSSHTRSAEQ